MRDKERYVSKHSNNNESKKVKKTRKFSLKTIIISVVALIQIILIMVSPTSAWVETISSILINGTGNIDQPVYTKANVGKGTGYDNVSIELNDFFKKAGNVHLSSASSADGKNFYFPVVSSKSGDKFSSYRKGTINDKNVNYIDFSFQVTNNSNAVANYFISDEPIVKFGDTEVNDSSVRMAFTIGGTTTICAKSAITESVVNSTTGTKATTTVKRFADYIKNAQGTNQLFQISANGTIEINVKMWLQDENAQIEENNVSIENFLITTGEKQSRVKVEYVDNYGLGDKVTNMGDILASSGSGNEGKEIFVSPNTTVTLNATAKDGYKFIGWYTDSSGTASANLNNNSFVTASGKDYTYYALFKKVNKLTLIAKTDGVNSGTGGSVKINSGTAGATAGPVDIVDGENATITATAKTGYKFVGWYDELGDEVSLSATESIAVTSTRTIYAHFQIKTYTVKAIPSPSDKGTVTFENDGVVPDAPGVKVTIKHGSVAYFVAEETTEGYIFKGWYTNSACTTPAGSGTAYTNKKFNIQITSDYTLYAKFELKTYTVNLYAMTNGSQQSAYGKVQLNTGTAATHVSGTVTYGNKVEYKAVENDNCTFNGWFDNANCTGTAVSISKTYTINSFNDSSKITLYAKFTIKTKSVTATVKTDTGTGPTVKINTGSATTTSTTQTVNYGTTLTLTADAKTGYKFIGWYTNSTCTTTAGTGYTNATFTTTVSDSTSANYYAKFEKEQLKRVYLIKNKDWGTPKAYFFKRVGTSDTSDMTWGAANTNMTLDTSVSNNSRSVYYFDYSPSYGYTHVVFSNNGSETDKSADVVLTTSTTTCYYNLKSTTWEVKPKIMKVCIISYIVEGGSGNWNKGTGNGTYRLHYWKSGGTVADDASCYYTSSTKNKACGSSYWNNSAQKFYVFEACIPKPSTVDMMGVGFVSGSNWFGNQSIGSNNYIYAFNYDGDKSIVSTS